MRRTICSLKAYDYVVVGGGSAGCVMANRLSQDPNVLVCLLEAGPAADDSVLVSMPLGCGFLLPTWGNDGKYRLTGRQKLNWGYWSEPGLNGKPTYLPRGRCLGGSSSINALIYNRGNKGDYDAMEERFKLRGWNWKECLRAFKTQEANAAFNGKPPCVNSVAIDEEFHGASGELVVENGPQFGLYGELEEAFLAAVGKELDLPLVDYNTGSNEGRFYYQSNTNDGVRWNGSRAFLQPVRGRSNLTIITGAHATKLLFDKGDEKKVTGVQYAPVGDNGKAKSNATEKVEARERVVVSLGAFGSPQLLQLSGVGERKELERLDIAVRHHLPGVGKNLRDHMDITMYAESQPHVQTSSAHPAALPRKLTVDMNNWKKGGEKRRRSPWSMIPSSTGFCVRTKHVKETDSTYNRPDIQGHFVPGKFKDHARGPVFRPGYALRTCLLYPESHGTLQLKSKDPFAYPKIEPNFLSAESDVEILTEGVRLSVDVMNSTAFDTVRKGSSDIPDVRQYVRDNVDTVYHPVGTCKMGHDDMAVVNDRFSVHGLKNISVIDASIYPQLPGGNTNAPTMMLAQRGAEFIKANDL